MKHFNGHEKLKFFFLGLFVILAFIYSFQQKSLTFFTSHPSYQSLYKSHLKFYSSAESAPIESFNSLKSLGNNIVNDIVKINQENSYWTDSEIKAIQRFLTQDSVASRGVSSHALEPFSAFRGVWVGEDDSKIISKDLKKSEDQDLNLQYLEFKNSAGQAIYGLNSIQNNRNFILSEVIDSEFNSIWKRVGVFINQQKIFWITFSGEINSKVKLRFSFDEVRDDKLLVRTLDFIFSKKNGRVDKFSFFESYLNKNEDQSR